MNIVSLLNQVDDGEIVLPAIQRDFVWAENKIVKLMDSIMRGYPIGIILMWETFNDIQYRKFDNSYREGNKLNFLDNTQGKKLRLVLDGQQRLQSLYIALYGKYENKYLYFDILSGMQSDDFEEEKYSFCFESEHEIEKWNLDMINAANNPENDFIIEYYVKVSDLFSMDVTEKQKYRKSISQKLNLGEDDELRLETNLSKLDEVLTKDQNILKTSIIDENKPSNSKARQSESDVLEIFVRINRQGTPLSRSDLIFSMLKLSWKESATALPDFVNSINQGNSFELDIDFVIRCLFAVSNLGTKFDINLLRKKSNMDAMQNNFDKCCKSIQSTIDHIQKHCHISSSKVLGGSQNLVPFVYYLFNTPNYDIPQDQVNSFKKSLLLFAFTGPFSRYADSRLAKFIREELKPNIDKNDFSFPYSNAVWWVSYWEGVDCWGPGIVQRNPRLALYIIQQDTGNRTHYFLNSKEIDHIFPRSKLRDKNLDEAIVNHFANFWILSKGKNLNKSNKHPKKYFEDVPEEELEAALIDRSMLDYRKYKSFIKKRESDMLNKLSDKTGITDKDFEELKVQ